MKSPEGAEGESQLRREAGGLQAAQGSVGDQCAKQTPYTHLADLPCLVCVCLRQPFRSAIRPRERGLWNTQEDEVKNAVIQAALGSDARVPAHM